MFKILLLLFLISFSLLGEDLLLRIQSDIPNIFREGMKEELQKKYNIIDQEISYDYCISNDCFADIAKINKVKVVIMIKVFASGENLKFKFKMVDFKNKIIKKNSEIFKIDDEKALYNFGKKITKILFSEENKNIREKSKSRYIGGKSQNRYIEKGKNYYFTEDVNIRSRLDGRVTFGILGSNIVGVNFEWMLSKHVSMEISTLLVIPMVFGLKYYYTPDTNGSFYFGAHATYRTIYFMPLGYQIITDSGIVFSIDLGGIMFFNRDVVVGGGWLGLKIGKAFK